MAARNGDAGRHGERRSPDAFPGVVEVVVEIPSGSRNKIEYDEAAGVYRLDRVLSSAVFYNFEYGFIDGTRAGDGDHDDAMVLLDQPTFTGCRVWARVVGGLEMRDDKGEDFKVLCVALGDPLYEHVRTLADVSPHRLREIEHFFATYKLLEDKRVRVFGWRERPAALSLLRADRKRWLDEQRTTSPARRARQGNSGASTGRRSATSGRRKTAAAGTRRRAR